MVFWERQQVLICIAAGAMIGGSVLFGYLPLRKRMKAVEQTRAAQRAVVTKALGESRQVPALKEQLQKLKREVGNHEAKIPGRGDLGPFMHRIADLMNEHNLREQQVQPGREVEAEGLSCIPVSMRCKGSLKQIFAFFSSLRALDRLVRIERVELENDRDFSGDVSMRTETVIYYRAGAGQV